METKRNVEIDILKGIGIILMVMGHAGFSGRNFIYLFHMAIFFMATGYLYKEKYTDTAGNLGKFIGKRVLSLYVPYVLADTIFNILNNFFLQIHFYSLDKLQEQLPWGGMLMTFPAQQLTIRAIWERFLHALTFQGSAELGMALWFLQVLFGISVLYALVDFAVKKIVKKEKIREIVIGVIAIALLIAGWQLRGIRMNLHGIEKICSYFILFYLGGLIRRHDRIDFHWMKAAAGFLILLVAGNYGRIELSANSYENPVFLILVSVAGWYFIYGISHYLAKISVAEKGFSLAGQNSLAVVILHFGCFKIVNMLITFVYGLPIEYTAASPILNDRGAWWILYTLVGVTIPVALNMGKKKLRQKYKKCSLKFI